MPTVDVRHTSGLLQRLECPQVPLLIPSITKRTGAGCTRSVAAGASFDGEDQAANKQGGQEGELSFSGRANFFS